MPSVASTYHMNFHNASLIFNIEIATSLDAKKMTAVLDQSTRSTRCGNDLHRQ